MRHKLHICLNQTEFPKALEKVKSYYYQRMNTRVSDRIFFPCFHLLYM